jgi:hypothetical protein
MDSHSNCWVNWKIIGQPCEFQVLAVELPTDPSTTQAAPKVRPRAAETIPQLPTRSDGSPGVRALYDAFGLIWLWHF